MLLDPAFASGWNLPYLPLGDPEIALLLLILLFPGEPLSLQSRLSLRLVDLPGAAHSFSSDELRMVVTRLVGCPEALVLACRSLSFRICSNHSSIFHRSPSLRMQPRGGILDLILLDQPCLFFCCLLQDLEFLPDVPPSGWAKSCQKCLRFRPCQPACLWSFSIPSLLSDEWFAPLLQAVLHEEFDPFLREPSDEVEAVFPSPLSPPSDVLEDTPGDPQPPEEW